MDHYYGKNLLNFGVYPIQIGQLVAILNVSIWSKL